MNRVENLQPLPDDALQTRDGGLDHAGVELVPGKVKHLARHGVAHRRRRRDAQRVNDQLFVSLRHLLLLQLGNGVEVPLVRTRRPQVLLEQVKTRVGVVGVASVRQRDVQFAARRDGAGGVYRSEVHHLEVPLVRLQRGERHFDLPQQTGGLALARERRDDHGHLQVERRETQARVVARLALRSAASARVGRRAHHGPYFATTNTSLELGSGTSQTPKISTSKCPKRNGLWGWWCMCSRYSSSMYAARRISVRLALGVSILLGGVVQRVPSRPGASPNLGGFPGPSHFNLTCPMNWSNPPS